MGCDELVKVGRIVGPHGVRGTIKLQALTDYPERFYKMSRIQLYTGEGDFIRSLGVRNVRVLESKGYLLVDTDEVQDRDEAEVLRGSLVMIPKSDRYILSEGEYWIDEIIGLKVVDSQTGEVLGEVVNVINTGENDLYEILTLEGDDRFIPAVSQFISKIDIDNGVIYIDLVEGLLD